MIHMMFECDNQDSCLLYIFVNGDQRKNCEANTFNRQPIGHKIAVKHAGIYTSNSCHTAN